MSPKLIKPVRLPVCLTKIKFPFIFFSSSIRVTNQSGPFNPDVLFIQLSTTFFENLALVVRIFFQSARERALASRKILVLRISS